MREPVVLRHTLIKGIAPFPVTPARAANKHRLLELGEGGRAPRLALQPGGMHFGCAFDIILPLLFAAQLASCAPLLAAEEKLSIFFLHARHGPVSDLWARGLLLKLLPLFRPVAASATHPGC